MGYRIREETGLDILIDDSVSWKAKGIFVYMALHSDRAVIQAELKEIGKDGINSIQTALRQLVKAGYIYLERRHGEKGHVLASEDTVKRQGWVYVLARDDGLYKIGQTIDFQRRLAILVLQHDLTDSVITISTDDVNELESLLHGKFAPKRVEGEWFRLDTEDVSWLKAMC